MRVSFFGAYRALGCVWGGGGGGVWVGVEAATTVTESNKKIRAKAAWKTTFTGSAGRVARGARDGLQLA